MADIAQLEAALVKADSVGAVDDARALASEIRRLKDSGGTGPLYKIGSAGWDDAVKQASSQFSPFSKFLVGFKGSLDDAAMRAKQLFGLDLTPTEIQEIKANRALRGEAGSAVAGDIAGQLAMTAVPAMSLQRGAAAVGAELLPKIAVPTAAAAITGATQSALTQPVLEGESTAKNAVTGAIGGALGDAAARTVARVAQPIMQSPDVKRLLASGIVPTPGQAAGGRMAATEEKLTSLPLTGDIIENSKNRVRREFNVAEMNLGMPEGKVSQAGNAGAQELRDASSGAYERVLDGHSVIPNQALAEGIAAAKQSPFLPLNDKRQKQFDAILENVLWKRIPTRDVSSAAAPGTSVVPQGAQALPTQQFGGVINEIPAGNMKAEIIGDLGKIGRKLQNSPIAEESSLGDAIMAARDFANNWLKETVAQSSPAAGQQIAALDAKYGARKMAEKAVEKAAAQDGVFTPYQAIRASRPNTETRELAEAAQRVIGNKVPNSGTTDRSLLAHLVMSPSSLLNPAEYAGIPLASLIYSRPGARYMLGDLIPGQQGLAELARQAAPYSAQVGIDAANALKKPRRSLSSLLKQE